MQELEIPALIDCHVHLRQNDLQGDSKDMLNRVAHYSGRCCDQIIAMPNTRPAIHDPDRIRFMRDEYQRAIGYPTTIHMVAKWLPRTTPADVRAAKDAGAIGFKLYPQGATTNSDDGMPMITLTNMGQQVQDVIGEMEHQDMVLMCHGEAPGFVMDRERLFLPWFRTVARSFKKLRLTLEHVTTREGLQEISMLHVGGHRVLGTITLHHLMRTLDDIVGGKLDPDEFCMPIPKRPEDRDSLLATALAADTCFALGSDSAPHAPATKYCKGGCAGVFTAPVLAQSLVELLGASISSYCHASLRRFTVDNACAFYNLTHSGRRLILRQQQELAPARAGLVTSFRGLEALPWSLRDD